jgi:hypothetical protein
MLGHGRDHYGIWKRGGSRGSPMQIFPRTERGWEAAWREFSGLEPRHSPALGTSFGSLLGRKR